MRSDVAVNVVVVRMKNLTLVLQAAWHPLPLHFALTLQALLHKVQGLQTHLGLGDADLGDHDRGKSAGRLDELLGIAPEDVIFIIYCMPVRGFQHAPGVQSLKKVSMRCHRDIQGGVISHVLYLHIVDGPINIFELGL